MKKTILRSKGGTAERTVPLNEVKVPDCWHLAMGLRKAGDEEGAGMVLETWHLAHDLLQDLKERYEMSEEKP
jgi:hypothetical protein